MPALSPRVRTPAQNRALWSLVGQLSTRSGLSRDELRPTLDRLCIDASGQAHTSHLSPGQADQVIGALERELARYGAPPPPKPAPHEPWGKRDPGHREDKRITRFQQVVIAGLFELLGMDAQARRDFSTRQCKVPWPQTQAHADALVEPLSAMALRRHTVESLRARVDALQKADLDAWKTGFVKDVARQLAEAKPGATPRAAGITPMKLAKLLECEAAAAAARGGE